jgi:hypothetical protein
MIARQPYTNLEILTILSALCHRRILRFYIHFCIFSGNILSLLAIFEADWLLDNGESSRSCVPSDLQNAQY